MGLRSGPMRPKGVAECTRNAITDLRPAWLPCEAKCAPCRTYFQITRGRICAFPNAARKRGAFYWLTSASIPQNYARYRESSCSKLLSTAFLDQPENGDGYQCPRSANYRAATMRERWSKTGTI